MPALVSHAFRVAVVVAVGAIGASASAEIHRCKDDRGQTVLSDRPCGAAYAGDPLRSSTSGGGVDRVNAGEMRTGQARDLAAQYSFMADRNARPARRASDR